MAIPIFQRSLLIDVIIPFAACVMPTHKPLIEEVMPADTSLIAVDIEVHKSPKTLDIDVQTPPKASEILPNNKIPKTSYGICNHFANPVP